MIRLAQFSVVFVIQSIVLFGCCGPLLSQIVYDNLDAPRDGGFWNADSQMLSAQSFPLGNHDTVDSATLGLRQIGEPDGTLILDLYNDNGGRPGSFVGNLGTVAPLSIPQGGSTVFFDEPVVGLTPHETYHLVFRHTGMSWADPSPRVFWSTTRTRGHDDAGVGLFIDPLFGVTEWTDFGPHPLWFLTSIEASLGQYVDGDYNANGAVEQGDLDLVLLHWGMRLRREVLVDEGWTQDIPTGVIDQEELDKVLLNWGSAATLSGASGVPEPSTVGLGMIGIIGALLIRNRWRREKASR